MVINSESHFGCLYLHGFLSSPHSRKAQQLIQYFSHCLPNATLSVPELPFSAEAAIAMAENELHALQKKHRQVLIIGSSLGGYYATYLSQTHQVKAALINPAVKPFVLFEHYLGSVEHFYNGQTYELTAAHLQELQRFDTEHITAPELLFLLLQTGDETLAYRHAAQHYRACTGWLEAKGDHSFVNFLARVPMLLNWL